MPLYMDTHRKVEGLTAEAVAGAHKADLEVQGKHGVNYLEYWFNEAEGARLLSGRCSQQRSGYCSTPRGPRSPGG